MTTDNKTLRPSATFPAAVLDEIHLELAATHDVPIVTLDDQNIDFGDQDFAEYSHLDYRGALRLTRSLLDLAILPQFRKVEIETASSR